MVKDLQIDPKKRSSDKNEIQAFLKKVKEAPNTPAVINQGKGRLLFAMDATASRQPTWDSACHHQAEMFRAAQSHGGLSVQICYFRGYDEFEASHWLSESQAVLRTMSAVSCLGGFTQIHKVLQHALDENKHRKISAIVFVGDAVEEDKQYLARLAGQLGLFKTPVFIFQEGNDPEVAATFQQIAQLSGGAYSHFDQASASLLAELLTAVAVYASGGSRALAEFSRLKSQAVKLLSSQLK